VDAASLNVLYLVLGLLAFLYTSGFGSPLTRVERASSDIGDEELCNQYVANGTSKKAQPKIKYPRSQWRVADPSNNGTPRCGRGLCVFDPRPAGVLIHALTFWLLAPRTSFFSFRPLLTIKDRLLHSVLPFVSAGMAVST
jgi:hypothetical protein